MRKDLLTLVAVLSSLPVGYAAPSAVPDGMSEIVLEARDVFGNGTHGFQLLLDSDHSTYGEIFFNPGGFFFGDYSAFEYKIPEDAEAVGGTGKCVVDGEVSILVPSGVYDWMTIVPLQEGLGIPNGEYAVGDDFRFESGKTYRFVAGMRQGQYAEEEYIRLEVENDYGVSSLRIPETGMGMTSGEEIGVTVSNLGTVTSENVVVTYSVNDGEPVREILPQPIAPGQSVEYVFKTKADFSQPVVYNVTATVEAPGDMIPTNNSVSGVCRHLQAVDLPFAYDFAENKDSFSLDWIVLDSNNDGNTWFFNEWVVNTSGALGVAGCPGRFEGDRKGDDWLVSQPLNLKAGPSHILFNTRSVLADTKEKLEVCYGTSSKPEDMHVAAVYEFASEQWVKKAAGFEVPADGVYYIAFHGVSENGLNIYISDLTVDGGEFVGRPEVAVTKTVAPFSNCDLPNDGKVGLVLENRGTGDLRDFTLACTVTAPDDSKVTVSETFPDVLSPDGKAMFMIGQGVDFSEIGLYSLEYTLTAADAEAAALALVECLEPFTEMPLQTNFTNNVNTELWTYMDDEGWNYEAQFNDFSAKKHGVESGLLGRGMTLAHPARVRMSYAAGGGWGSTSLAVLFGKAGEDPASYAVAYQDDNVTNQAREIEFTVPVASPGNYSLVIADTGDANAFLRLNEIVVSEVFPHDLRVETADGPVARYMPASHTGRKGTFTAVVANRGSEPMTGVKVSAEVDGKPAGTSVGSVSVPVGETVSIPVEIDIPAYGVGDSFSIGVNVSANEEDGFLSDNAWMFPAVSVTDQMLATENLEELANGTGEYGAQLFIGNIYHVAAPSALTSVALGLCGTEMEDVAKTHVGLNIYTVVDGRLGRRIFSHECERGKGGFLTVDMQDMLLPAGAYYFEAAQLSTNNFGLAYDPSAPGTCWMRTADVLTAVNGYALSIRAFFAPDAKVFAKDAAAVRFVSPEKTSALFGDGETVVATVRNAGSEDAEFDVDLLLDGVTVGRQHVEALFYEDKDVEFSGVDLSAPGSHTLECRVVLSGDENEGNNSASLSLESAEPLDPYTMDFEGCSDFDANGDRFNPAWTTEDRNGVATDLFWRYEHPNRGVPCGFMAFNTHATKPSMDETPVNGFYAYEGDRFGVAFCYNRYAEGADNLEQCDVWIVSPVLQLGDGSSFTAYVKTFALESPDAKLEPFRMLVSEEAEGYDGFVALGEDVRLAPVEEWGMAEADLSAYDNKKVRVAVQYVGVPANNTCLMIDNLKVNTTVAGVSAVTDGETALRYDGGSRRIIVGDGVSGDDVYVYSADGTCVAVALDAASVDVSHLPSGIYIARTSSSTLKFAK